MSKDGAIGVDLTQWVLADPDGDLSCALTTPSAGQATYLSKEGGQPPRIVLVVSTAMSGVSETRSPVRQLREVSPNPVFRDARVVFEVPGAKLVDLVVLSVDGRLVRTLFSGERAAGRHEVWWDGLDTLGNPVRPGFYIVRLESGGSSECSKMILLP